VVGVLDGKVVLITGASSGIGEATARLVAEQGALPVLSARRSDMLEVLAQELPGALAIPADVRDPKQVHRMVETTMEHRGRIEVLINNAGQGLHLPLEQVSLEDLVAITELNFYAPLVAMQAVVPIMRARGGGAIVNVSSGTSQMVLPGVGAYAATKGGHQGGAQHALAGSQGGVCPRRHRGLFGPPFGHCHGVPRQAACRGDWYGRRYPHRAQPTLRGEGYRPGDPHRGGRARHPPRS
jgi:NAD(P)-dependent dehydrogenase (short-subunit alcohol dehydrogenase family)